MSRIDAAPARRVSGFPRVSGDEPVIGVALGSAFEFSPRERG